MFRYNNELKDSKVEYIGKIPKSWEIIRNKHIFNKTKVIAGPNWDKYNVLSLTKNGVIIKDIERNEGKMPSDFSIYQIVNPGNLLMCLFDIDVTPRCVGYIENKGIVSAAYTELSPIVDINMKYYYWWYLMLDIDKQLLHLSKNLRNSLSTEDFMALSVVKPPLEEQIQIANYLDKKTAKIDSTIAKNKKLIDLLEEKRVSLINQIVTKGLNPDVPMKDSGIEWIGNIPEHWDIINLKKCCETITDGSHFSPETTSDGKYYITVRNVLEDTIDFENAPKISIEDYKVLKNNGCEPKKGDVLLSKDGTIGKCIVVDKKDFVILSSLGLLRPNNLTIPEYLRYYLLSDINIKQMNSHIRGSAIKRLTINIIKELLMILPPLDEQEKFVQYLNPKIEKINNTIKKIQYNIELLEEYKTSVIQHVVTGKIDVREEMI